MNLGRCAEDLAVHISTNSSNPELGTHMFYHLENFFLKTELRRMDLDSRIHITAINSQTMQFSFWLDKLKRSRP
jgi:hypothetical protein